MRLFDALPLEPRCFSLSEFPKDPPPFQGSPSEDEDLAARGLGGLSACLLLAFRDLDFGQYVPCFRCMVFASFALFLIF